MTRKVKSGSSFCPMLNSEKPPAARISTTRKRVRLPWRMAQREMLKPPPLGLEVSEVWSWFTCPYQRGCGALRGKSRACHVVRQPDLHAVLEELHAAGDDDIAILNAGDAHAGILQRRRW